jgi:hypothetical protein
MGLKHRESLNMSACTGIWETLTTFLSETLKEREWIILK